MYPTTRDTDLSLNKGEASGMVASSRRKGAVLREIADSVGATTANGGRIRSGKEVTKVTGRRIMYDRKF